MHASQLLTWTGVGIVAPIVMWLLSKDESRDANRHGLVIVNWMLSSLVYLVISGLAAERLSSRSESAIAVMINRQTPAAKKTLAQPDFKPP